MSINKQNSVTYVMLFLIGMAISVSQFVMVRDFVSVLFGEEVVIVLVTMAFFFGLSVGYYISRRLSRVAFEMLFIIFVFAHLSFPFSYRYLAAWFAMQAIGGLALIVMLFIYASLFTALFAVFLPRLVSDGSGLDNEHNKLRVYYSLELLGFIFGFFLIMLTWNYSLIVLLPFYWSILGFLLVLVTKRTLTTVAYYVCTTLAVVYLPQTDKHSTAMLYEYKHGIPCAKVLYSVNSPYQKVEVIADNQGTRYLFLDGLQNLNSTDLVAMNYYVATLPATLIQPKNALIIGNGSLSSVLNVYENARSVYSVELDEAVLEAGRRFFADQSKLKSLKRWTLQVDDGKRWLKNSQLKFDLIIMDIPSPLTIQEAYLHTKEFYRLAYDKLTDRGVIAVLPGGKVRRDNRTPVQVVVALKHVFKDVMIVHSKKARRSFAYASKALPFSTEQVRARAKSYEDSIKIVPPHATYTYLARTTPFSVDNMAMVLRRGLERFDDRYFHTSKKAAKKPDVTPDVCSRE